ncbi:hypothetical protein BZL30_9214 [Mycobacterium kansasii]|uniref:Uncharacterized protein n=1 Tax=Mycobacterium kansasii TaxID=1768 RepID=A0A1V3WAT2_MYCKA|nr:hypothetical protein BZL30_9214 [Mycobacterium kansasii]
MVGNALTTTRWPTPNTGNDTPGFTQLQPVLPTPETPPPQGTYPGLTWLTPACPCMYSGRSPATLT